MNKTQIDTVRFDDLGIKKNFLEILKYKGFITPTPIQHQVIPGALEGKDVVGIAQTGTGKTLAYGIPLIQILSSQKGQGLVLVPTRELAQQVADALNNIGKNLGLRLAVVIGGVSSRPQIRDLRNSPHIVIATPGRLDDLMEQRHFRLNDVKMLILDEADRMLDVGFLPQIKRIFQQAPKDRQTMLFSATMPPVIASLASAFMRMPLRIEIAPQGTSAENVEQEVFVVSKPDKMRLLFNLLQTYKKDTILIFSRTKHGAKHITRDLRDANYTATEIHSNRTQAQRKTALDGFSNGRFRILVATDIAARGIDVKQISVVINYDLPDNSEDYVHRIGRTGRAGRSGKAISFVAPSEKADIRRIEKLIRKSLPILDLPIQVSEPFESRVRQVNERITNNNFSTRNRGGNNFHKKNNRNSRFERRYGRTDARGER
ncbi:MAG: DEAD/DEAH box helicase [Candidatus Magasanikbacteria bacterium]